MTHTQVYKNHVTHILVYCSVGDREGGVKTEREKC